jgi:hypothetical protein
MAILSIHCRILRAAWIVAAMLSAALPAQAAHVTLLPTAPTGIGPYDPRVYGASPAAEKQALRIAQAWRNEPATMPWTSLMLEMIVKHKTAPSRAARGSALLHVAMHEAAQGSSDEAVRRIAVSAAACQVLGYWFSTEEHGFDRIMAALLAYIDAGPGQVDAGLALGYRTGRQAVARGEADGAARGWNGVRLQWYGEGRVYGPGKWVPTPPYYYYPPDEPFAPQWKTWTVDDPGRLRPTPPAFGSARFLRDLRELVELQKNLSPQQLRIARFWVDGSGSVTPPGHWNRIAQDLVRKHGLGEAETARLFAMLNIALADTFITVWHTKYYFWTARPVTMAKVVLGVDITPAILTPPFPSYVSGHAAFSGAAARILGAVFPQEQAFLDALAEEAAMSRLYGGIHYRHDNEDGLMLGRAVADIVLDKLR